MKKKVDSYQGLSRFLVGIETIPYRESDISFQGIGQRLLGNIARIVSGYPRTFMAASIRSQLHNPEPEHGAQLIRTMAIACVCELQSTPVLQRDHYRFSIAPVIQ
jgi:hypothetical protein